MPKYLDLIYRVKDEASAALAKIRRSQDQTGKSSESLRQTLKGLRAGWTELKSVIGLAQQALRVVTSLTIDQAKAWNDAAISQGQAAAATDEMTAATERAYRQALLAKQLEEERNALAREWGGLMSTFLVKSEIQIRMLTEQGRLVGFNSKALQEEIDRRLELIDVQAEQKKGIEGLTESGLLEQAAVLLMADAHSAEARALWDAFNARRANRLEVEKLTDALRKATDRSYNYVVNFIVNGQPPTWQGQTVTAPGNVTAPPVTSGGDAPPRLQGNTQADRDRYNREYRLWVNR
jgi:hypothetical protein